MIKQRLAVHLTVKQTSASIDSLLERHSHRNKQSPLFQLFPFNNQPVEPSPPPGVDVGLDHLRASLDRIACQGSTLLCMLYSVEGLFDDRVGDSAVFVLDPTTRADFQGHVALSRPMTMVLVTSANAASGRGGGQQLNSEALVDMTRFDVSPTTATMVSFKAGMALLTRLSPSLERAKAILEALDCASTSCSAEDGLMDACAWLVESVTQISDQFDNLLSASESPLHVVEAFMKRFTVLRQLQGMVCDPNGVFLRLESHVRGAGDSSPAFLQFRQRVTELSVLASEYRVEALWASVLSKSCLNLKLSVSPKASQSLDGLYAVTGPLIQTLTLVFAAGGAASCRDSTAWDGAVSLASGGGRRSGSNAPIVHVLRHLFVPLLSRCLLEKCSEYLSLNTMFSVECVPDADDQKGYILPLCSRAAIAGKLPATAEFVVNVAVVLQRYAVAYETQFPSPVFAPMRQTRSLASAAALPLPADAPTVVDDDGVPVPPLEVAHRALLEAATGDIVGTSLIYAAARCDDLVRMIRDIDACGCGMMTKEVRCLCDTIHLAASSFPLLDGAHVKNWQRLFDVFQKTKTLKYVVVEPVSYESREVVAPVPAASLHRSSAAPPTSNGNGNSDGTASEELQILRSRVTILSAELKESRELLSRATSQLEQTQTGLQQSEEMNVVLMRELRRLMADESRRVSSGDGGTIYNSYDKMIDALALSELSA